MHFLSYLSTRIAQGETLSRAGVPRRDDTFDREYEAQRISFVRTNQPYRFPGLRSFPS